MEQGTLVGTILAWVLLFVAMCFDFNTFQVNAGNLAYFVDAPSLLIVLGELLLLLSFRIRWGMQKVFWE